MQYPNPGTWNEYPNLPWIHVKAAPGGGFYVRCTRTGDEFFASNMNGVHMFAADHSHGLGNVVHRAAKAVGATRCGACAKRQAALNGGGIGALLKTFFSS
jgi:hypothetical protein